LEMVCNDILRDSQDSDPTAVRSKARAKFANEIEQALFDWIDLIVMDNLPLNSVKNSRLKRFCKHKVNIGIQKLKETILQLVMLVERRIGADMREAKMGQILHDGWTKCRIHCIGLMASFTKEHFEIVNCQKVKRTRTQIVLLAVSPMHGPPSEEGDAPEETIEFSAKRHKEFIHSTFCYFDVVSQEWILCQGTDNTSVNRKLARLLKVPQVGCLNHRLALDVNDMINATPSLKDQIENIAKVMTECRASLKNAAILRNLTDLKPEKCNATCWSSKFLMMDKCKRMWKDIKVAADHKGASDALDQELNRENAHHHAVCKSTKMLKTFNLVTVSLQTRAASLIQCRKLIDFLMNEINNNRNKADSPLYKCKFAGNRVKMTVAERATLVRALKPVEDPPHP